MSRELRVEVGNKAGLGYVDIPQAWGLNNPQQDNLYGNFLAIIKQGDSSIHIIVSLHGKQEQAYTESLQVGEYGLEF